MNFLDAALLKPRPLRKQFLKENNTWTTFDCQLWNWYFQRFPKVLIGNLPFVVQNSNLNCWEPFKGSRKFSLGTLYLWCRSFGFCKGSPKGSPEFKSSPRPNFSSAPLQLFVIILGVFRETRNENRNLGQGVRKHVFHWELCCRIQVGGNSAEAWHSLRFPTERSMSSIHACGLRGEVHPSNLFLRKFGYPG